MKNKGKDFLTLLLGILSFLGISGFTNTEGGIDIRTIAIILILVLGFVIFIRGGIRLTKQKSNKTKIK